MDKVHCMYMYMCTHLQVRILVTNVYNYTKLGNAMAINSPNSHHSTAG